MSIDEIINGSRQARYHAKHQSGQENPASSPSSSSSFPEDEAARDKDTEEADYDFPGLIPLVESYLDSVNVDVQTRCELAIYLDLISRRASGRLVTTARWMRDFVAGHPAYAGDSVVSEEVNKDLISAVMEIAERESNGSGFAGLEDRIAGWEFLMGDFRKQHE